MSTMNSKEYIEKMLDNISTDIEVLFVANVVDKTEIKDLRKTQDSILTCLLYTSDAADD